MTDSEARAVPLIERLRNVPKDALLEYAHGPCDYSMFPIGLMCHEAADALASPQPTLTMNDPAGKGYPCQEVEPASGMAMIEAAKNAAQSIVHNCQGASVCDGDPNGAHEMNFHHAGEIIQHLDEALAALRSTNQGDGWRPIEIAPDDDTPIEMRADQDGEITHWRPAPRIQKEKDDE